MDPRQVDPDKEYNPYCPAEHMSSTIEDSFVSVAETAVGPARTPAQVLVENEQLQDKVGEMSKLLAEQHKTMQDLRAEYDMLKLKLNAIILVLR